MYYNNELCNEYLNKKNADMVKTLLEEYDVRRTIEIEKKYIVDSTQDVYNEFIKLLENKGYTVCPDEPKEQIDYYYDTKDKIFYNNDYTLRIRKYKDRYFLTLKTPSNSISNGESGQLERNEIEREISSNNINDNEKIINNHLKNFFEEKGTAFHELYNNVNITNKRKKVIATKNLECENRTAEKYEIVFDNVEYMNIETKKSYSEHQIEIELKSSVETRINMKGLTDELEREISSLQSISESKYHRAVDTCMN